MLNKKITSSTGKEQKSLTETQIMLKIRESRKRGAKSINRDEASRVPSQSITYTIHCSKWQLHRRLARQHLKCSGSDHSVWSSHLTKMTKAKVWLYTFLDLTTKPFQICHSTIKYTPIHTQPGCPLFQIKHLPPPPMEDILQILIINLEFQVVSLEVPIAGILIFHKKVWKSKITF